MRSYNQRKKNNIIIGTLCAVVLLMVVGYAAFSSVLNIKGTSSINSNWDIEITNIRGGNPNGGDAYDIKEPTYTPTTATFNTGLKTPGTNRVYEVEVTNKGTLTGLVTIANLSCGDNEAIECDALAPNAKIVDDNWNMLENPAITNGIEQFGLGKYDYSDIEFTIAPGEKHYIYVDVYYKDVESQPENLSTKINLELNYEQAGLDENKVAIPNPNNYTGTVYSNNVLTDTHFGDETWQKENLIWPGDALEKIKGYTKDYRSLNSNFFLKHIMNNGQVESSELCVIKDEVLHCLKPNEYETTKASLLSIFGAEACRVSYYIDCNADSFYVYAYSNGFMRAYDASSGCQVESGGDAYCY